MDFFSRIGKKISKRKPEQRTTLVDGTTLLRASNENLPDELIEALILYDHVLIDRSVLDARGNYYGRAQINTELLDFFSIAELAPREERQIYLRIASLLEYQLSSGRTSTGNFNLPPLYLNLDYLDDNYLSDYSDYLRENEGNIWGAITEVENSSKDIILPTQEHSYFAEKLGDQYQHIIAILQRTFGNGLYHEVPEDLLFAILRCYYYLYRQHQLQVNLTFDPLKGGLYSPFRPFLGGMSILDVFDEDVRVKFQHRKNNWLGDTTHTVNIPMLRQYFLDLYSTKKSLSEAIRTARNSEEAVMFRQGMADLQAAYSSGNIEQIDKVIKDLSEVRDIWSERIGSVASSRSISVTLAFPILEIGKEFSIPNWTFRKSPADNLLVFIHKLVTQH